MMGESFIVRRGGGAADYSALPVTGGADVYASSTSLYNIDLAKKYIVVCSAATDGSNPRTATADVFFVDNGVITERKGIDNDSATSFCNGELTLSGTTLRYKGFLSGQYMNLTIVAIEMP